MYKRFTAHLKPYVTKLAHAMQKVRHPWSTGSRPRDGKNWIEVSKSQGMLNDVIQCSVVVVANHARHLRMILSSDSFFWEA